MPNARVLAAGGALPSSVASLQKHGFLYDAIRIEAERAIVEHVRSRQDLEALIERLVTGLDEIDGDADHEPSDDFEPIDEREPGPDDGAEETAPESYGRGFGPCAAEAAKRDSLFIAWKGGCCTAAAFIPSEGRASL